MRLSISRSQDSIWVWLLWGLGTYLLLELGPFFLFGVALKKTATQHLCPYIACAMPGVIFMPFVWRLWQREKQDTPAKQLAREWGVSAALFVLIAVCAVIYSGVRLGLMNPSDAIGGLIVSVLLSVPLLYFTLYHMTLTRISSKAAGERGGTRPK